MSSTKDDAPPAEKLSILKTTDDETKSEKVQLKKELGLLEGIAVILGIIFGSGIYKNNLRPKKTCLFYFSVLRMPSRTTAPV